MREASFAIQIVHFPVAEDWEILRIWGKYRHGRKTIYSFTKLLQSVLFTEINYLILL